MSGRRVEGVFSGSVPGNGIAGLGKMHEVLWALITFPSLGRWLHFVLPPAMYENA